MVNNSLILNRINAAKPVPPKIDRPIEVLSPPIPPDELKGLLMSKLSTNDTEYVVTYSHKELILSNIYDFADWYSQNKDKFNAPQQVALDTLVQARDSVFAGCNCKRQQREYLVGEYFKDFWKKNRATDLPSAIRAVADVSKLTILDIVVTL